MIPRTQINFSPSAILDCQLRSIWNGNLWVMIPDSYMSQLYQIGISPLLENPLVDKGVIVRVIVLEDCLPIVKLEKHVLVMSLFSTFRRVVPIVKPVLKFLSCSEILDFAICPSSKINTPFAFCDIHFQFAFCFWLFTVFTDKHSSCIIELT